jgi:hypothetical protein
MVAGSSAERSDISKTQSAVTAEASPTLEGRCKCVVGALVYRWLDSSLSGRIGDGALPRFNELNARS